MDGAGSSGVVLISFGSTVLLNTVSTQYQAMFFHLIEELSNVKFILRWSGPLPKFLDKSPKNLLVSEWLPQKEILSKHVIQNSNEKYPVSLNMLL